MTITLHCEQCNRDVDARVVCGYCPERMCLACLVEHEIGCAMRHRPTADRPATKSSTSVKTFVSVPTDKQRNRS